MTCYVYLAMSLHYLNIKVEGHSNDPCLTIFLLSAGSTENNHMTSVEKPMLRSSHSGNWRERAAPNKQTASQREFSYYVYKKRGARSKEGKKCFEFCCGFSNPLGTSFGEKLSSSRQCASKYHSVHFKPRPKDSLALFICRKVSKKSP